MLDFTGVEETFAQTPSGRTRVKQNSCLFLLLFMLFYLSVLPLVYVRAKGNLEPGTLRAQSTWVEDEEGQEIHTVVVCIFEIGPEDSPACSSSVKYVLLLPLPFLCLPLFARVYVATRCRSLFETPFVGTVCFACCGASSRLP